MTSTFACPFEQSCWIRQVCSSGEAEIDRCFEWHNHTDDIRHFRADTVSNEFSRPIDLFYRLRENC